MFFINFEGLKLKILNLKPSKKYDKKYFLIILIGFMMSCQNRSTDDKVQAPAGPDLSKLEVVVVNVKGITCTGCEKPLRKM